MKNLNNLFSKSITLKFKLNPVGKTEETFLSRIKKEDETRALHYPAMKEMLDDAHRQLIAKTLSSLPTFDWSRLIKMTTDENGKSVIDKKNFATEAKKIRKAISECFKANDGCSDDKQFISPSKFIKSKIDELKKEGNEIPQCLLVFKGFGGYLNGYSENRQNLYGCTGKHGEVSYRAVNENFPIFHRMTEDFKKLERINGETDTPYHGIVAKIESELADKLAGESLSGIFQIGQYGRFVSQEGIDFLNGIIGGYTKEDGTKVRGINEFISLCRQADSERKKISCFKKLNKQLLMPSEGWSFVGTKFNSDEEMAEGISAMLYEISKDSFSLGKVVELISSVQWNDNGIFVNSNTLDQISHKVFGSHEIIGNLLSKKAESAFKTKSGREKYLKRKYYPLNELAELHDENGRSIKDFWDVNKMALLQRNAIDSCEQLKEELSVWKNSENHAPISDGSPLATKIKDALDKVSELFATLKPFRREENEIDQYANGDFYAELQGISEKSGEFNLLYNCVRNRVTMKLEDSKKIPVMFGKPSFGGGWSVSTQDDYRILLFRENSRGWYLGVPLKSGLVFDDATNGEESIEEMDYYQNFSKNLAKILAKMDVNEKPDCALCIDYLKKYISADENMARLGFKFKETSEYASVNEFYNDFNRQAYSVSFRRVSKKQLDAFVENGEMCLFQIWCKDFSEFSTGSKNLHTLYWENLFSEENLKSLTYKLNGGAQVFWRPAVISSPVVHKKGDRLLNRWISVDGEMEPMPEEVHLHLCQYLNGRRTELDNLDREWLAKAEHDGKAIKTASRDIVKDRRYTRNQFEFHVPIVINPNANGESASEIIRCGIREGEWGRHVIGIDRGERNLIYVSVIDQNGSIVEQQSLNLIESNKNQRIDFKKKLDGIARDRLGRQRSWRQKNAIKDCKGGYLSAVVHKIAELAIKYKAVVALEDLNLRFKQTRSAIESSVYQQFEGALISKFEHLVFKDASPTALGGILNGLQLCDKFQSFERMTGQNGILFYVPASYTSKFDPSTGFASLFDFGKASSIHEMKSFLMKFKSIVWDVWSNKAKFIFDQKDFGEGKSSAVWEVFSTDERWHYDRNEKKLKFSSPTAEIIEALKNNGENLEDNLDIKGLVGKCSDPRKEGWFVKKVFDCIRHSCQMRHSDNGGNDFILSPVRNSGGIFFDSRKADPTVFPDNADANGAYGIALKGLIAVNKIKSGKDKFTIKNDEFLSFVKELNQ